MASFGLARQKQSEFVVNLPASNCPGPGDKSIPHGISKHIPNEWIKQLTMFLGWMYPRAQLLPTPSVPNYQDMNVP